MRPTIKILCLTAISLTLFSQCKARKNFGSLSSDDSRLYNPGINTNVVQELMKGMKFAGDVNIALSPDGKTLATVGSVLTENSSSENDLKMQDFTYSYESNKAGQGGLTAVYLWDTQTLQPTARRIKKLDGYNMKGIKKVAFTTDGKGLALCGESGVAFWPNTEKVEESKFWSTAALGGNCLTIAFGKILDVGVYGNELFSADVLAIGTSLGVIRYMQTKEKPAPEVICTFGKPVSALSFLGEVKTKEGYTVPDANQLLVTVGSSAFRSGFQLLENRTRSLSGIYGILPFVTMPAIGKLNTVGLNLGNVSKSKNSNRSITVSCNEAMRGTLEREFANPSDIATSKNEIMLSAGDNRYVQFLNRTANGLEVRPGARKKFIASAEAAEGGISTVAVGGPYGVLNQPFYFTGGSDRAARIWQYNIDGTQNLDLMSQINMGINNRVTSAVFLKDKPYVIFGDRGGVFVWNFAKALQPTKLSQVSSNSAFTAIGMNDTTHQVYLGSETGEVSAYDYETGAVVQRFGKVLAGPVGGIEVSHDLSTAIAYSGFVAKLMTLGSNPEVRQDLNIWDAQNANSIVGFKYGSDNESIFSVSQSGSVRVKNKTSGESLGHNAELANGEKIVEFSIYPMDISYQKMVEFNNETNENVRDLEIHPVIVPVIQPNSMNPQYGYINDPFQIFGENQRKKIEKMTGQTAGTSAKPSQENPDVIAGSKQSPAQANDQKAGDQNACQNGDCQDVKTVDQAISEVQRRIPAVEFRVEKTDVKHLKVGLLTNTGRIIMVDLQAKKQWNIEYRTSPVLSFSGFFQEIYRPVAGSQAGRSTYLTADNPYLAKTLQFDDDGACLMILIRSGEQIRCLPVLQSSATNAPAITALSSKPAKPFLDPWIVYNGFDRKFSDFKLAQYYTMVIAADSKGGITSFELNHFRMPPYSKRMYRTNYTAAATRGSVVKKFATTSTAQYAVAIHADNTVRLHWIDRAFELPLLDISNEELDALRDFAQ